MIQLIEPLYTDETSKTSKPVTTVRFPRSCIPRPVTIKRHIEKLLVVSPSPRRIDIPACLARIDRIAFHSLLFAHYDEKKYIYMYISLHVFNSLSRNIGNLREKFEHRTFFFFLFFDLPMDTVCLFVLLVWSFFFSSFLSFLFLYIYFFFRFKMHKRGQVWKILFIISRHYYWNMGTWHFPSDIFYYFHKFGY